MSAEATNGGLYLEPLPQTVWSWGRLGPVCECCDLGPAAARCWFRPGFSFVVCWDCCGLIAMHEAVAFMLRWGLS